MTIGYYKLIVIASYDVPDRLLSSGSDIAGCWLREGLILIFLNNVFLLWFFLGVVDGSDDFFFAFFVFDYVFIFWVEGGEDMKRLCCIMLPLL